MTDNTTNNNIIVDSSSSSGNDGTVRIFDQMDRELAAYSPKHLPDAATAWSVIVASHTPYVDVIRVAQLYHVSGRLAQCIDLLRKGLVNLAAEETEVPTGGIAVVQYLLALCLQGADKEEARRVLQQAERIQLISATAEVAHLRGLVYWKEKLLDKAARQFLTAGKMKPNFLPVLLHDAVLAVETKKLYRAWQRYIHVLQYFDDPPVDVYVGLAVVFYRLDNFERTIAFIDIALTHPTLLSDNVQALTMRLFRLLVANMTKDPTIEQKDTYGTILQELGKARRWFRSQMLLWLVCESIVRQPSHDVTKELERLLQDVAGDAASVSLVHYTLGRVYHTFNDLQRARAHYEASSSFNGMEPALFGQASIDYQLDPESQKSLVPLLKSLHSLDAVKFLAAVVSEIDPPECLKVLKEATSRPGLADTEVWIMRAYAERRSGTESLHSLAKSKAVEEEFGQPGDSVAIARATNEAAYYLSRGDAVKARGVLTQLASRVFGDADPATVEVTDRTYPVLVNLALMYLKEGDLPRANALYEHIATTNPLSKECIQGWAVCAARLGRRDRHVQLLTLLRQIDPTDIDALLMSSALNAAEGVKLLNDAMPKLSSTQRSIVLTQQGNLYYRQASRVRASDETKAIRHRQYALLCYARSLDEDTTNVTAQHNAACTLATLDVFGDAKHILESVQATHANPELDASTILNLGIVHMRAGQYRSAAKAFGTVLDTMAVQTPEDVRRFVVHSLNLAVTYLQLDAFSEAMVVLQRALRRAPLDLRLHYTLAEAHVARVLHSLDLGININHETEQTCLSHVHALNFAEMTLSRIRKDPRADQLLLDACSHCLACCMDARTELVRTVQAAEQVSELEVRAQRQFKARYAAARKLEAEQQAEREARYQAELEILRERTEQQMERARAAVQEARAEAARQKEQAERNPRRADRITSDNTRDDDDDDEDSYAGPRYGTLLTTPGKNSVTDKSATAGGLYRAEAEDIGGVIYGDLVGDHTADSPGFVVGRGDGKDDPVVPDSMLLLDDAASPGGLGEEEARTKRIRVE
eukprot:PhM_4_TR13634/c0_g1_i2/m.13203/K15176/CTR9; RNA polymerase-associated protein CTR9